MRCCGTRLRGRREGTPGALRTPARAAATTTVAGRPAPGGPPRPGCPTRSRAARAPRCRAPAAARPGRRWAACGRRWAGVRVDLRQIGVQCRHQLLHLLEQPLRGTLPLGGGLRRRLLRHGRFGHGFLGHGGLLGPALPRGGQGGESVDAPGRAADTRAGRSGSPRVNDRLTPTSLVRGGATGQIDEYSPDGASLGRVVEAGLTAARRCRMEAWIFASSPSPSRALATTPS